MTEGHRHRMVRVSRNGLAHRVLTKPLLWSRDVARVDASPYPWGLRLDRPGLPGEHYYLSALSILHRWTGLTLYYD